MAPLDGLLVISLEQAVAAPYATRLLTDAGARVIKVERAEGDFARGYDTVGGGTSSYFAWLNGGKESVVLDLKSHEGRDILETMLDRADVFVQNLAPGAAERLGVGSRLETEHPRLITCSISGFGEAGPLAARKAYDLIVQAETGLASITGTPDGPGRVGISVCDIATGSLAYSAILEALIARGRTGRGEAIAISLFDVMAEWMTVPYCHARYGRGAPGRLGLAHPSIAPYGVYPTQGAPLLLAIQNEREWRRFCTAVMQDPELADDPRFAGNVFRVQNRQALNDLIEVRFLSLLRSSLEKLLDGAGIVFGSVNEVADFLNHKQLRLRRVQTEGGPIDLPALPERRWTRGGAAPMVPALDQHGDDIRAEFANHMPQTRRRNSDD